MTTGSSFDSTCVRILKLTYVSDYFRPNRALIGAERLASSDHKILQNICWRLLPSPGSPDQSGPGVSAPFPGLRPHLRLTPCSLLPQNVEYIYFRSSHSKPIYLLCIVAADAETRAKDGAKKNVVGSMPKAAL